MAFPAALVRLRGRGEAVTLVAPGRLVRKLLGERRARAVGRLYRALFVDMAKASAAIAAEIPQGAHVLDVGGGDGEPLNHLLGLRPDIRVTTIDVAAGVGRWIDAAYLERVARRDSTSLADYLAADCTLPDVLLLSDVVHHVSGEAREALLAAVRDLLQRSPRLRIIVKDVEPGHWRATLGLLSDRYVTGDRDVRPIGQRELVGAMERVASGLRWRETGLFAHDPPNYALVFWQ